MNIKEKLGDWGTKLLAIRNIVKADQVFVVTMNTKEIHTNIVFDKNSLPLFNNIIVDGQIGWQDHCSKEGYWNV